MGIFRRRKVKIIDKPIEERTIPEIIESVEHVNPMNKDSILERYNERSSSKVFPKHMKGILSDTDSYLVNQNQQGHFNSGHYDHKDFVDWARGTGRVVKGKTQEDKDKFMRCAKAENELDLSVQIYIDKLWMIDSESKVKWNHKWRGAAYKNPINLSNRKDSTRVIKEVFSQLVKPLYNDIKDAYEWHGQRLDDNGNPPSHHDWLKNLQQKHREYMNGVCHILAIGGHGYYEACNYPCELENLAWSKDLPFAKAYSLFVDEIDPGVIECIQWCNANRHTKWDEDDD
jgi:hypothetical protein